MSDPGEIKKLITLLALAFLWCHRLGEEKDKEEPIKVKKHERRATIYFGTDWTTFESLSLLLTGN